MCSYFYCFVAKLSSFNEIHLFRSKDIASLFMYTHSSIKAIFKSAFCLGMCPNAAVIYWLRCKFYSTLRSRQQSSICSYFGSRLIDLHKIFNLWRCGIVYDTCVKQTFFLLLSGYANPTLSIRWWVPLIRIFPKKFYSQNVFRA